MATSDQPHTRRIDIAQPAACSLLWLWTESVQFSSWQELGKVHDVLAICPRTIFRRQVTDFEVLGIFLAK